MEEGDIVNIDVTVFIGGHHGDCSETFLVWGLRYISHCFLGGNCIFVNLNINDIPSYSWWGTWTLKVRPWFKLGKVPLLQVVVVV